MSYRLPRSPEQGEAFPHRHPTRSPAISPRPNKRRRESPAPTTPTFAHSGPPDNHSWKYDDLEPLSPLRPRRSEGYPMTDLAREPRVGGPSDEWCVFCHLNCQMSDTTLTAWNRVYHLDVIQQPQRARACGFGDKVSRARGATRNHMLRLYLGPETSIAAPYHSPLGDDAFGRASGHQVSRPGHCPTTV